MAQTLRAVLLLSCLIHASAQDAAAPRVAITTKLSNAMAAAYKGAGGLPWAHAGAPPTDAWKGSARGKYQITEAASLGYLTLDDLDKRFRNIAIAVSMDWELMVADTYALLQAGYETIHPWRTGRVIAKNWTEAQGNRFAALTSSVGDVLAFELTKGAMLTGTFWPDFAHALYVGQFQEVLAEQKLTKSDWQLYVCDEKRNPIFVAHNSTSPDIHFIPQLEWVSMPLDMATFTGDVLAGDSKAKWVNYEQRGADLWEEYRTVMSPVVKAILKELGPFTGEADEEKKDRPWKGAPAPDELIVEADAATDMAVNEYNAGKITDSTYSLIRSLILSVGIASNTTSPVAPTCASSKGSVAASQSLLSTLV